MSSEKFYETYLFLNKDKIILSVVQNSDYKIIYEEKFLIDDKSNKELDKFISNYNSDDKKFFNKITFKTFVNKIFVVYFG